MLTAHEIIELNETYGAHNYHPLPVVITEAKGIWVTDVDGKRYLDCLAAYSAVNQGHCHPRLVAALVRQAERCTLTSRAFHNDQLGPFCRELSSFCGKPVVLPMNTGAEAVETAVKLCRRWGHRVKGIPADRAEIICCAGNFHGRTVTIVSADALAAAIGPHTAGFLVEPIQGEAGVVVPPQGFLTRARELCTQHRVLLLADEIQSGFGRAGRRFACDLEGVVPDLYILGKALAGGLYPVSAVVGDREVMDVLEPGSHGSTFGGNPLGIAVAREALRVITEERLPERSAELGEYFLGRLRAIGSAHVEQVRGAGLWIGIVLKPSAGGARRFCEALMHEGILCKETHERIIRVAPPLVIERADVDWALDRFAPVLCMG
jgi:ornithine--oxo-acid transaminase